MQTLIIIPTYNEIDNLKRLTEEIFSVLPQTDILIVDDNSPNGTGELVETLSHQDKRIKLIKRAKKLGLGSAYIQGFKYALANNYDFIFEMDADFSHPPAYLPEFLRNAQQYNLVLGSRYIKGGGVENWQGWRRALSYAANLYARIMLGLPYHDLTSGYKCYTKDALKNFDFAAIISEGYIFQIETTYRLHQKGDKILEIPIVFKGRQEGKSKISRGICFETVWKVLLLRLFQV